MSARRSFLALLAGFALAAAPWALPGAEARGGPTGVVGAGMPSSGMEMEVGGVPSSGMGTVGVRAGEVELRFSGALEGSRTGRAVWLEMDHPERPTPIFTLVFEVRVGDELRVLEAAHLKGENPGPGEFPIRSLDELPGEPDPDFANVPDGFMVSYTAGRWSSWEEVAAMARSGTQDVEAFLEQLTGGGYSSGGTLRIAGRVGDWIEGSFSATMILMDDEGNELPFGAEGEFRAQRVEDPFGGR